MAPKCAVPKIENSYEAGYVDIVACCHKEMNIWETVLVIISFLTDDLVQRHFLQQTL